MKSKFAALAISLLGLHCLMFGQSPDRSKAYLKVSSSAASLPLSFEPNRGQTDPRVKFFSRGRGYQLFLPSAAAVPAFPRVACHSRAPGASTTSRDLQGFGGGR